MKALFKNKITPWWNSKMSFLFAIAYLHFYLQEISFTNAVLFLLAFVCSGFFVGFTGHLINDWFDLEDDIKAVKFNSRNYLGSGKTMFLILLSIFFSFFPWFFFQQKWSVIIFVTFAFLIFLLYSVPFFRFKERKLLGIISDALYAYLIPSFIIFYFDQNQSIDFQMQMIQFVLLLWVSLVGVQQIVIHQLCDLKNDQSTGTRTWTVFVGEKRARTILFNFLIPLQFFIFYVWILLAYEKTFLLYILLTLTFFSYQVFHIYSFKTRSLFINSKIAADLQLSNVSYNSFFPYLNLLLLILVDFQFIILLLIHFVLFNFSLLSFFYKRILYPFFHFIIRIIRTTLSKSINYGVYYFRRFILFETRKKAMREHYEEYLNVKKKQETNLIKSNIALINANENKYTETFVLNHAVSLRKYNYLIHELFGYPIPANSKQLGGVDSSGMLKRKFINFWNTFLYRNESYQDINAFKTYLIKNNIELVLAEFGTCGVEVFEICQELNIPLIVVFYGYDIHHKSVLDENKERYQALFSYASLLIGVSREIVDKLEKLGAESKKVFYLPCSLNFGLFTDSYSPENDFTFLSVGRFTETKSPHLLILAFNEVLKMIPEAELRMIGKDGGGELFEACQILVKALGIEKKVAFLGVLPPEEVQWEMSRATVFVQHSLTTPINSDKEGTPVSVMEAMATGMPIVSTKHAGILDLIENEVNGILVDEYAYLEMAKQMIRLAQDKELRNFLGKNAANSIRNNALIMENSAILASLVEKYKLD